MDTLNVVYDGHVLGVLKARDAMRAHCLQIGALYLYDTRYDVDSDGKSLPELSQYYKCMLNIFWGLEQPSQQPSGNAKRGKKKPEIEPWQALWNDVTAGKNN